MMPSSPPLSPLESLGLFAATAHSRRDVAKGNRIYSSPPDTPITTLHGKLTRLSISFETLNHHQGHLTANHGSITDPVLHSLKRIRDQRASIKPSAECTLAPIISKLEDDQVSGSISVPHTAGPLPPLSTILLHSFPLPSSFTATTTFSYDLSWSSQNGESLRPAPSTSSYTEPRLRWLAPPSPAPTIEQDLPHPQEAHSREVRPPRDNYDCNEAYALLYLKVIVGLKWKCLAWYMNTIFKPGTLRSIEAASDLVLPGQYKFRKSGGFTCKYYRLREKYCLSKVREATKSFSRLSQEQKDEILRKDRDDVQAILDRMEHDKVLHIRPDVKAKCMAARANPRQIEVNWDRAQECKRLKEKDKKKKGDEENGEEHSKRGSKSTKRKRE